MSGGGPTGFPEKPHGNAGTSPPAPAASQSPATLPDSAPVTATSQQKTVVSAVSFTGAVMVELSGGWPENASAWALLLVGAALLGLVAGGFVFPGITRLLSHPRVTRLLLRLRKIGRLRRRRPNRAHVVIAAATVLTVGLAYFAGPPALTALGRWVFGCPQTTELTVLTSPSGLAPVLELVDGYERWTESRDGGCAAVDAYVYATPDIQATNAVSDGWITDDNNIVNPSRDIGPRPDVWFPDSGVDLARHSEHERAQVIAEETTVAVTPVVLAVPAGAREKLPEQAPPWPEVVGRADTAGIEVVRADPSVSTLANIATSALYGDGGTGGRAVERAIGRALDRGNYKLPADDPDLLCRYRELVPPATAVVVSERDMVRFNRGQALGGSCGVTDRPHVGDDRLVALYPHDLAVAQQLVRFRWTPDGSRRALAVRDLQQWLADEPGRRALEEAGLRPVGEPVAPAAFTAAGAERDPARTPVVLAPSAVDATRNAHLVARRASRMLVALDVSGSMKEEARPGQTRLQVVTDGIRRAVDEARRDDEVGLWLFPADGSGRGADRAVPVGPLDDARRSAIADVLNRAGPDGNTPLFDTTAEGVRELGPSDDEAVTKLIVVTDGEDTTSTLTPDGLLDVARAGKVRVYVIAIGGTSCAARPLETLTADTGGACYAEAPTGVGPRVMAIVDD